jgi:hypothetical protein
MVGLDPGGTDKVHYSLQRGEVERWNCAPCGARRSLSSNTRTLYSANLSRSRSMDKEPLSFSNSTSGSLSLSWLTSSLEFGHFPMTAERSNRIAQVL